LVKVPLMSAYTWCNWLLTWLVLPVSAPARMAQVVPSPLTRKGIGANPVSTAFQPSRRYMSREVKFVLTSVWLKVGVNVIWKPLNDSKSLSCSWKGVCSMLVPPPLLPHVTPGESGAPPPAPPVIV
jgi:hypothetical protein